MIDWRNNTTPHRELSPQDQAVAYLAWCAGFPYIGVDEAKEPPVYRITDPAWHDPRDPKLPIWCQLDSRIQDMIREAQDNGFKEAGQKDI